METQDPNTEEANSQKPLSNSNTQNNTKTLLWIIIPILLLSFFVIFYKDVTFNNTNLVITPTIEIRTTTSSPSPITILTETEGITSPVPTETAVKYTLNVQNIRRDVTPLLELEFIPNSTYAIETSGDIDNQLTIKNNDFTMTFSTYTETSPYWGQYSTVPENAVVESQLEKTVFRIKSNESSFPDYYYTTSFETRGQGGCAAYSKPIQACDGGNIEATNGSETTNFSVGCATNSETGYTACDQILSSLKVTIL